MSATPGELKLEYRIKQEPDEALLEMTLMDTNGDGTISSEEKDTYFRGRAARLITGFHCRTAGKQLTPEFIKYDLQHSLVQVFHFVIPSPAQEIQLEDRNFPHKPGSVRIELGSGVKADLIEKTDLSHAERVSVLITRKPKR